MKTTDFKSKLKPIITIAVFILLIITIIVQAISVLSLKEKYNTLDAQSIFLGDQFMHEKRDRIWGIKLIYACYNNKIYPCDDKAVTEWNEQNPDKAITAEYLQSLEY